MHDRVKVIGFGHEARVGKDTACDYLMRKYPSLFRKRAYATSLKNACAAIFGFTPEQLDGEEKELVDPFWGNTPRRYQQLVGTEGMRRAVGEDVWVKSWKKHTCEEQFDGIWLVPDVRFLNEAQAVKDAGGILVKVVRPKALRDKPVPDHSSERALKDYVGWDYVLRNTSTDLETFYRILDEFMEPRTITVEKMLEVAP